jgi:hypothetical protein
MGMIVVEGGTAMTIKYENDARISLLIPFFLWYSQLARLSLLIRKALTALQESWPAP